MTRKNQDPLSEEGAILRKKIKDEWDIEGPAAELVLQTALEAFDRMRQAQRLLKKHGVLMRDRFGFWKANPATIVERDSRTAMLTALKQLGIDLVDVE